MNNKRPFYCSYYLGNAKGCRSSLPGMHMKAKYIYFLYIYINHKITPLISGRTSSFGAQLPKFPHSFLWSQTGGFLVGPPEASDHALSWEVGLWEGRKGGSGPACDCPES